MYFENKEIDPRDCQYRANSKIRKQIELVIRENKIKFGLLGEKLSHEDAYRKSATVKNRFKSAKNDSSNENKENQDKDAELLNGSFGKVQMVTFLEQLEALMFHEEEHKQAFSYNDLVKIHQLLQYMEEDPDAEKRSKKATPTFRNQFFFQFMEDNFKVIQPEKRKNVVLDERIRKLKYQAARKDYDTMTSSVSRAFLGGTKGAKSGITIGQELRNIRSTLIATANAFMVIVATFAFFYMALGYVRPDATIANRVLFSFSASMVVAAAEVYFLIRII